MNEAKLIIRREAENVWYVTKIWFEGTDAFEKNLKCFNTEKEAQTYLRKL